MGFFTKCDFFINGEGEIESNRFFRDSRVLGELIEKIIDRYDDRTNI